MTISASEIITLVRGQLVDQDSTQRWSDAELLRYISDAQRAITAAVPSATSAVGVIDLIAGTRQTIPSNGYMFLNAVRNMQSDGVTPSRAVRQILRDILDAQNPDWHAATPKTIITNSMYDPSNPNAFFVYPPADGTGKLEILYSKIPTDVTSTADNLDVIDIYRTAIVDYVMYRAYQKDSDFAAGQQLAATYFNAFTGFLGVRNLGEEHENSNQQVGPFNPGIRGAAK